MPTQPRFTSDSIEHPETRLPLLVDLDGLVKTNLEHEAFLKAVKRSPWLLPLLAVLWLRDRAIFKRRVAELASIDPATVPYRSDVLDWISTQRASGREVVLVGRCDALIANHISEHLGIFSEVLTEDVSTRPTRRGPSELMQRCGVGEFDYVGSVGRNIPIVESAHSASLVDASKREENALSGSVGINRIFMRRKWQLRHIGEALRVRQWSKNVLVYVPLLAAHRFFDLKAVIAATVAFLAFCFCASATYIVNDLLDLDSDRSHKSKRNRPFASGALPIGLGLALVPVLLALSIGLVQLLPPMSMLLISAYFGLTLSYSFFLKQKPLVDVFALAILYSLRVLIGGAAVQVSCSPWLIGFSLFLFLSLAFAKRCSELFSLRQRHLEQAAGRAYFVWDMSTLNAAGISSAYTAGIVLAEYIHSDEVRRFYRHPSLLWLLVPILLYWMSRLWLIANRGALNEDPVVFATRDRVVYILALIAIVILFFGSVGTFGIPGVIE